jgi:molecular chaperone GrpE
MKDDKSTNHEELITHNSDNPSDDEVRGTRHEVHWECEQCEEYLNGWKRAQADYANLKKDMEKARLEVSDMAKENLLFDILPALDQFSIALEHLPDISALAEVDRKKMENWLVGIKAVKQLWDQTFAVMGLEHVDATGVFDPAKHIAVGKEEHADRPSEAILKVVQPGWSINNKVIKPAKVIVNKLTIKN